MRFPQQQDDTPEMIGDEEDSDFSKENKADNESSGFTDVESPKIIQGDLFALEDGDSSSQE